MVTCRGTHNMSGTDAYIGLAAQSSAYKVWHRRRVGMLDALAYAIRREWVYLADKLIEGTTMETCQYSRRLIQDAIAVAKIMDPNFETELSLRRPTAWKTPNGN